MPMDTDQLQYLLDLLKQRNTDVRAEVLLWQAMCAGIPAGELLVKHSRFFEREYVKDITGSELVEDEWHRRYLEIQLARPGFYDMLPESLFFQPDSRDLVRRASVADMAAQYQHNKWKERDLRRFFQPFENELFHQQVQLEKEEVALLDALNNQVLNRFLSHFWGLPAELPASVAASFILLLPCAHLINGNPELMQQCLSLLLGEEVRVTIKPAAAIEVDAALNSGLGYQQLGDSMICGTSFMEDYPVLQYYIGPLGHTPVSGYIEGGVQFLLLETFNHFFAPAGADIITEVAIEKESGGMSFTAEEQPVLGYTSVL